MNSAPNDQQTSSGRRRSSGFMPAFASLLEQKRGNDQTDRRASLSDQLAKPGLFGQFFHNNFGKNAPK